jgi:hypothetical protein
MQTAPRRIPLSSRALFGVFLCLGALICLGDPTASAGDDLHFSGFGTAALSRIDEPAGWAFTRNLDQKMNSSQFRADLDSRLGVQVNYTPTNQFELVGQAVASRLPSDAQVDDALELAFVAYRPDGNWTLRAGRVNMDAYLLSDHRDVGFAYEFVRPPVEFYSQTPTSLDGADVSRAWTFADTQWRLKLFGGRTSAGTGGIRLVLEPLFGAMISRETEGLLVRVSAVHTDFPDPESALVPLIAGLRSLAALPVPGLGAQANALASGLDLTGEHAWYVAGGMQYDRHDWLFTGEVNVDKISGHASSSYSSGYASLGRRFGAVSIYAIESVAARAGATTATPDWATLLTPFGPAIAQQAQALGTAAALASNSVAARQHSASLGTRWDMTARTALKVQWDHIQTDARGSALWAQSTPAAAAANVVTVAVDFVF